MSETVGTLLPTPISLKEKLDEQVSHYQAGLTDRALDWLNARGIEAGAVEAFRLGEVTDPYPEHVRQQGWLVIPYLTTSGVASIRFRCLEDHRCRDHGHGKYKGQKGDVLRVFNAKAALGATDLMVCEGEVDTITLAQLGYMATGFPGASSWRPHHSAMLAGAERIYIWADPDDAGQEFADQVLNALPRARQVPLHKYGLDVNDLYVREGVTAIWDALEAA